ncbi:MAG: OmpA family protein [Bacteroidota bacterium]
MKNSGKISLLLFLLAGFNAISQNMVVNPAMDVKCSSGYGEITKTETWTNANDGTVDLFDRKNAGKKCEHINAIPQNYMGYQPALSDQNYAGIIAYYDDGPNTPQEKHTYQQLGLKEGYKAYSEYLQAELAEPMVAGKIYLVSFKVSLAEKSGRAVSCLGALLTTGKVEQESNSFLEIKPQFISHRVISDSVGWVTLSGAYIAEGGEKFLTIGCFKDDFFRSETVVSPMENDSRKAYYYISNVAVGPYMAKPDLEAIVFGVDFVELMDLQFAHESTQIEPQFQNELNEVASWMVTHPEMSFFIAGYTDKTGNNDINDPLSLNRAKAVKKYLISKGVKESNLVTEGFGSSNPIENKIKSRRNRRVEIYLYSIGRQNP